MVESGPAGGGGHRGVPSELAREGEGKRRPSQTGSRSGTQRPAAGLSRNGDEAAQAPQCGYRKLLSQLRTWEQTRTLQTHCGLEGVLPLSPPGRLRYPTHEAWEFGGASVGSGGQKGRAPSIRKGVQDAGCEWASRPTAGEGQGSL